MSLRVGLVRHGAHDDLGRVLSGRDTGPAGGDGIGLNPAGRAQVQALAGRLAGRGIARIETSPQTRTRQTAAILGRALGPAPVVAAAFDEIDFGAWAGRGFAALAGDPGWDLWNAARAVAPTPGGETMAAAVARAVRHLDALADADMGGAVLAVSHCDIIRGVVAWYLGLDLDHVLRFDVAPGAICWLELQGAGSARILGVNAQG